MDDPFFVEAEERVFGRSAAAKKVLRILHQTGKKADYQRDSSRHAQLPGKRISKTGHVYWETRKNRTDDLNKKV